MQRAVAGAELQRCGELLRRLADTAAHGSAAPHRFTADRVILMESDLRPSGSVYSELGAWSFGPIGEIG
jgi:2'-5' RNA ligase